LGQVVTHTAAIQAALEAWAKADAAATLNAAFDYCDPIYEARTDVSGMQIARMM
jgi:hypothetical protein